MKRASLLAAITLTAALALAAPAGAASGSGGGGSGGGGGGGGGGGTTTSVGAIREVSTAAVCDGGSTIGVTLKKGFDKRVEVSMLFTPSAAGTWEFHVRDITHDKQILGMASTFGGPGGTSLITVLGGTVPVGTSDITFLAQRRDQGSSLSATPTPTPVVETCTAAMTVVAR